MKVIILAGGRGTRLPDTAKDIPKVLARVGEKPMIEHQIEMLRKHGLTDLRFSLGFRAEQVIEYLGGGYEYVVESRPLGTGGALRFASRDLDEPFMALNGDVVGDMDIGGFLNYWNTLETRGGRNAILVSEVGDARDFGLLKLEGEYILRFSEKPREERSGFINAGLYILEPEALRSTALETFSIENDVFPRLALEGRLYYFLHRGAWTDLGTEERLRRAHKTFL